MGMKVTLIAAAHEQSLLHERIVRDAMRDGRIDGVEAAAILDSAEDLAAATAKAKQAKALAHAIERGVEKEGYVAELFAAYRVTVLDELPMTG